MPDWHALAGIWSAHVDHDTLLDRLRTQFHMIEPGDGQIPNLLPIADDWRLSNRYNGRHRKGIVEPVGIKADRLRRWVERAAITPATASNRPHCGPPHLTGPREGRSFSPAPI